MIRPTDVMLRWMLLLVYWISATAAVHVFMQKQGFFEGWHDQAYAFERMLDRTAERPFVYRALMPWLVNTIDDTLPESARARYADAAKAVVHRYTRKDDSGYWTAELERKYMIAFVLLALFGTAALWALRSLTAVVFPSAPALRDAGPLLFGTMLPLTFMNGGFMYDFAELFFLFASFALVWRRRYVAALGMLALGVLNKETMALSVIFLAMIAFARERTGTALRFTIAAAAVAAILVVSLRSTYADLPGSTMYSHALDNLRFWSDPASWVASMNLFVPLLPVPRGLNLLLVVPIVLALSLGWHVRDPLLRRLLLAGAAVQLPLFFLFCWRDETRNLSLLYPALYLNLCAAMLLRYGHVTEPPPSASELP